jgi:hypothetical protein
MNYRQQLLSSGTAWTLEPRGAPEVGDGSRALLPCPNCQGSARRADRDAGMNGTPGWYAAVACTDCGLKLERFTSTDAAEVIAEWNAMPRRDA